jgi:UDP-N-acetylglucosamine diphosphorylase/glucosamine-1-phosphate N-acetyltransferase
MRLILLDQITPKRFHFNPLALSRPIWELRCGITSLAEKLIAKTGVSNVACFCPEYMAAAYRQRTAWPVNDLAMLSGDDLFIIHPRVKAEGLPNDVCTGPSRVKLDDDGECLFVRVAKDDLGKLNTDSIDALIESAKEAFERCQCDLPLWNYTWDLVLENPEQLTKDFAAVGRTGIEGTIEQPNAIRGGKGDIFIGKDALVHPMVVLDAEHGPIYLDEGVEVHPFTRIEGPCYVGKNSILLGAKCREGMSIGPMCRVGGEVEESIIQGYSNKYHDGFLGHAYVGEWVNLGALTTNSDLKNDYSSVSVVLDGRRPIDTGSTKVGSLIGDHTKTSIGTLFNTGAYVGAMALIAATGKPLPKFIPSFAWYLEGVVTKGFGKKKLYETASKAMPRRGCEWTEAEIAMWDAIYDLTEPVRKPAIDKGRRMLASRSA